MKLDVELAEHKEYEVIVLGGGPAGCAAAAAAARGGAKTLLVEASGMLGGMGTLGLVPAWSPFWDQEKIIYCGMAKRVFEETKNEMPHLKDEDLDWVPIDVEVLKRVYDRIMQEYGVDVLFHTMFSHALTEDGAVKWVILSNKDGLVAYSAKVFIDTTGDGDLCACAGAPYEKGDGKGELQPGTHCFILSNVDEYAYINGPVLHRVDPNSPIHRIAADDSIPDCNDVHMCSSLVGPGTVGFNAGHIWNLDNTVAKSTSHGEMLGREIAYQLQKGLAKYHPKAFANAHLVATAGHVGIRETRRILGDYCLTTEDYFARRSFADEIGRNCYYIDIHNTQEEVEDVKAGDFVPDDQFEHYKRGESHGIPYRCLIPQKLTNVLMAGRCISTDRIVQGSTRVMPVCLVTGEAAGTAAALCVKHGQPPREVDTGELRTVLKQYGAYLPDIQGAL